MELNLEGFRLRLENERTSVLMECGGLSRRMRTLHSQVETDWIDLATEDELEPVLQEVSASQRRRLGEIRDALERLQKGQYGMCEDCGTAVEAARLEVLPWAARCRNCQEEEEKRSTVWPHSSFRSYPRELIWDDDPTLLRAPELDEILHGDLT